MKKEITAAGKTIEEAKENARLALGATDEDEITYKIIEMPSKGIFGIIGVKPAKVQASIEVPDAPSARRNAGNANAGREGGKAPRQEKQQNRAQSRKNNGTQKEAPAPKAALPETELKMEKVEVVMGQDRSYDFICKMISDLQIDAHAELFSCEDGTRRIVVGGKDAGILIGHHGETLDALQYLANLACSQKNDNGERDRSRVTLDIEGYRAKREDTLRALARRMSAKALRTHHNVTLEPMSAYERRIIHSEVQGIEGVTTVSIGSDNNRRIVIYLAENAPVQAQENN